MYRKLAITLTINVFLMFLITFALIDQFDHLYFNINRFYMSVMMTAPMAIVMLLVMGSMYPDRRLNTLLIGAFAVLFLIVFALARTQTPVGNEQFLRSMIPHHSSAIVMCEEAALTDPEILTLCEQIVETQKREIAEMKALLAR